MGRTLSPIPRSRNKAEEIDHVKIVNSTQRKAAILLQCILPDLLSHLLGKGKVAQKGELLFWN